MEIVVNDISELEAAAKKLLANCTDKRIFAFIGEMGSGKTTFIQSLCKILGVKQKAMSPSFSLVHEYHGDDLVYHLDLYRLTSIEEALAIGIEEYLASGNYCFIEWAERITPLLPEETVKVEIEVTGEKSRTLKITDC